MHCREADGARACNPPECRSGAAARHEVVVCPRRVTTRFRDGDPGRGARRKRASIRRHRVARVKGRRTLRGCARNAGVRSRCLGRPAPRRTASDDERPSVTSRVERCPVQLGFVRPRKMQFHPPAGPSPNLRRPHRDRTCASGPTPARNAQSQGASDRYHRHTDAPPPSSRHRRTHVTSRYEGGSQCLMVPPAFPSSW